MSKESSGSSTAEEKPEPHRFIPNQNKRTFTHSRFYHSIKYILRKPFSNTASAIVTTTVFFIGFSHALAYFWKGPGHPLNRFRWRQMKKRGELTPEMIEKERILNKFYYDNITTPREAMQQTRYVWEK